ncbi:HAD family hydrolase [Paenibacillus sp. E194]|uniref:bis(5'-nucleosyl)-tetraphosphatase (symmetrical) YqeK n=1 Tax=Paenibacillus sp. E194 TaxID=1458845 RepID=UPI0005CB7C23|nr:bis(5'-nucleosyl)-tetraphosphatase (symmetrical) YqeK [Paenibacillus sp. E194]KJB88165.1 HAD family hydrolase [Paenibacillus sp. E194]
MHLLLNKLVQQVEFTGNIEQNIQRFLTANHCPHTADHSRSVGAEAGRVARIYGADPERAELAGWLHDISAVFPNEERIEAARQLGIDILPEEEQFPMIIHQKLSKVMARDIFGVQDAEVLDAVGCHTTLRADASQLDLVLFVADKIAWDQQGTPPYIEELHHNLAISLEHAAFAYIQYLWERKDTLKVIHPWLADAYKQLHVQLNAE